MDQILAADGLKARREARNSGSAERTNSDGRTHVLVRAAAVLPALHQTAGLVVITHTAVFAFVVLHGGFLQTREVIVTSFVLTFTEVLQQQMHRHYLTTNLLSLSLTLCS